MIFLYFYGAIGLTLACYMLVEKRRLDFFKRMHLLRKEIQESQQGMVAT